MNRKRHPQHLSGGFGSSMFHDRYPMPSAGRAYSVALKSFVAIGVLLATFSYPFTVAETGLITKDFWGVKKEHVAQSISEIARSDAALPEHGSISVNDKNYDVRFDYTIDRDLNQYIDGLLKRYNPAFAAVVAMEPDTGRILSVSSHVRDGEEVGNLALHSGFPAASIFKIVTAAAVINEGVASPNTTYKFNGKNTSLYKKNVLRHKDNKWTRKVSLKQAFATSINTVFGQMGVYQVGAEKLNEYADVFGFNRNLNSDLLIEPSVTQISTHDEWSVAEAASGYTKSTKISPLHAATIVSALVNDGVQIDPVLVDAAYRTDGPLLYASDTSATSTLLTPETAQDMQLLLGETVRRGSARKSFRGFFKGAYKDLKVGGKTGSLTGTDPKGRTEWFAGYGDSGDKKIAVAVVIVNKKKWYVKPAYVVRKTLEEYFKPQNAQT